MSATSTGLSTARRRLLTHSRVMYQSNKRVERYNSTRTSDQKPNLEDKNASSQSKPLSPSAAASISNALGAASASNSSTSEQSIPLSSSVTPESLKPSSRFLQSYPALVRLSARTGTPLPSLAISFLILHELTAILPVIFFFYVFSSLGLGVSLLSWIKGVSSISSEGSVSAGIAGRGNNGQNGAFSTEGESHTSEGWKGVVRAWYEEGERRVEKVGKKYGILGYEKRPSSSLSEHTEPATHIGDTAGSEVGQIDIRQQGKVGPAVANAIAAYVVVKALLPVRIAASVGLAPAFARFALNPVQRLYGRFRRVKS